MAIKEAPEETKIKSKRKTKRRYRPGKQSIGSGTISTSNNYRGRSETTNVLSQDQNTLHNKNSSLFDEKILA